MADLSIRVGSHTAQGLRANNEDRFVADLDRHVFLVADGMGGQDRGEIASGMAADIIPQVVQDRLAAEPDAAQAVQQALAAANRAIIDAARTQPEGRRMGTTAVLAVERGGRVYVAGLGDSRAYLIRGDHVDLLTVDHSVAQTLVATGVLSAEEARHSQWQHVLYKFLGCAEMADGADVRPFTPQAGDRLLLASDGLTGHVDEKDLRDGARTVTDPQAWCEHLVRLALERGSRDNVTCVIVAFERE